MVYWESAAHNAVSMRSPSNSYNCGWNLPTDHGLPPMVPDKNHWMHPLEQCPCYICTHDTSLPGWKKRPGRYTWKIHITSRM